MIQTERSRFLPLGVAEDQIVWLGQPEGGLKFQSGDVFLIPFSLLWCGFAIFWETMAISSAGISLFALFGLAFVLVGLYFVAGRFVWDIHARANSRYALTADSALIVRSGLFPNSTSVFLPSVSTLNMVALSDGSGTIYFGPKPPIWSGTGWASQYGASSPAFRNVADVASVYAKCQEAQRR